jgi:hypothetical protein
MACEKAVVGVAKPDKSPVGFPAEFHLNDYGVYPELKSQVDTSRYSSDLFGLAYPKAFISKIRCYDNGDRTYPHRDLPAANKHHPFEDEPQGVSDRDDKKNRSRKLRKRILAQLS